MRLSGEEYSKRLRAYSDDTIRLISQTHAFDREDNAAARDITTNSELNEEQVAEKLKELIATVQQKKGIKSTTPKTT